ncbi:MAG: RIP metalloprotease RseP [Elusimicrobiota bacterium]|jgi:regulator of sigma E protease|nr:RIP metalloprotease RseP [Elusimicrobiota bacterium]
MVLVLQIVAVLVGLGFLIFIHELGHFTAARLCKVRVLTFSFGFGPDLVKYIYKGTKYCIKLIPFGGFVAMAGEDPEKATGAGDEYLSLPWFKKVFIAFAGPLSNYILAFIMFSAIFSAWGIWQYTPYTQIGTVLENGQAFKGGILPNDTIKSIDGIAVTKWGDITDNLKDKANKEASFVVERDAKLITLNFEVGQNVVTGAGVIGISPKAIVVKASFLQCLRYGLKMVVNQTVSTLSYLGDKIIKLEKPDISGPVGIMQVIAKSASNGWEEYLSLIAFISVALGLFNLFPIPFVDGGMIVLFLIEGIRKKRVGLKAIGVYNTIGIVLIGGIFIFATYSDLLRIFTKS